MSGKSLFPDIFLRVKGTVLLTHMNCAARMNCPDGHEETGAGTKSASDLFISQKIYGKMSEKVLDKGKKEE